MRLFPNQKLRCSTAIIKGCWDWDLVPTSEQRNGDAVLVTHLDLALEDQVEAFQRLPVMFCQVRGTLKIQKPLKKNC